jgi:hypothetical protein
MTNPLQLASQGASRTAKAIFAGLVTLGEGLILVVTANETLLDVTTAEWVIIATAVVVAVGGVYGITNKD